MRSSFSTRRKETSENGTSALKPAIQFGKIVAWARTRIQIALNLTFRQPARSDDQAADSFSSVAGGLVEAGLPWRRCEARAGAELPAPTFWDSPSAALLQQFPSNYSEIA